LDLFLDVRDAPINNLCADIGCILSQPQLIVKQIGRGFLSTGKEESEILSGKEATNIHDLL
jgi:hypothetical protein